MLCERFLEEKNKKATVLLSWCHKLEFDSDLDIKCTDWLVSGP